MSRVPYVRRAANRTLVGQFEGYLAIASRDEVALMEAVWRFGPVAVSINAGGLHTWADALVGARSSSDSGAAAGHVRLS